MTIALIVLLTVAALLVAASIRSVLHDGPSDAAPPASHVQDPRFRAPAALR